MGVEEVIKNICQHIAEEAGKIVSITNNIKVYVDGAQYALAKDFEDIRINELEQLQKLTLMLTGCVMKNTTPENDGGFSVDEGEAIFAEGELMSEKKGEDDDEDTEAE